MPTVQNGYKSTWNDAFIAVYNGKALNSSLLQILPVDEFEFDQAQMGGLTTGRFFVRVAWENATNLLAPNMVTASLRNSKLQSAAASGATTITVSAGDGSRFKVGQTVSLWDGNNTYDTVTINSIATDTLTLSAALGHAWPAGAPVFVLRYRGMISARERDVNLDYRTSIETLPYLGQMIDHIVEKVDIKSQVECGYTLYHLLADEQAKGYIPDLVINSANFVMSTDGSLGTGTTIGYTSSSTLRSMADIANEIVTTANGNNSNTVYSMWIDEHNNIHFGVIPTTGSPTVTVNINGPASYRQDGLYDTIDKHQTRDNDTTNIANYLRLVGGKDASGNVVQCVVKNTTSISQYGQREATLSNTALTDVNALAAWGQGRLAILAFPREQSQTEFVTTGSFASCQDLIQVTGFNDATSQTFNAISIQTMWKAGDGQFSQKIQGFEMIADVNRIMRDISLEHYVGSNSSAAITYLGDRMVQWGLDGSYSTNTFTLNAGALLAQVTNAATPSGILSEVSQLPSGKYLGIYKISQQTFTISAYPTTVGLYYANADGTAATSPQLITYTGLSAANYSGALGTLTDKQVVPLWTLSGLNSKITGAYDRRNLAGVAAYHLQANPNPGTAPLVSGVSAFTYTNVGQASFDATFSFTTDQTNPGWLYGVNLYVVNHGAAAPTNTTAFWHQLTPTSPTGVYNNVTLQGLTSGISGGLDIYCSYVDQRGNVTVPTLIGTTASNPLAIVPTNLPKMPNGATITASNVSTTIFDGGMHVLLTGPGKNWAPEMVVNFTLGDSNSPNSTQWGTSWVAYVRNYSASSPTDKTTYTRRGPMHVASSALGNNSAQTILIGSVTPGQSYDVGIALMDGQGNETPMIQVVSNYAVGTTQLPHCPFPGGYVNTDGSFTHVDGVSSTQVYTIPSGGIISASADIAKGVTNQSARIVIGNLTNGYALTFDQSNTVYIEKWVAGVWSGLTSSVAHTADTNYHSFRLTINQGSPNTIEASWDGQYMTITDAALNLTSGTWPITLYTGGNSGKVLNFNCTITQQHYVSLPNPIKHVIGSNSGNGQLNVSPVGGTTGTLPRTNTHSDFTSTVRSGGGIDMSSGLHVNRVLDYITDVSPNIVPGSDAFTGWNTGNFTVATGGPGGATDLEYTGTGVALSGNYSATSPLFAITPGNWVQSWYVDWSQVTSGQPDMRIFDIAGNTIQDNNLGLTPGAAAGRYYAPSFTVLANLVPYSDIGSGTGWTYSGCTLGTGGPNGAVDFEVTGTGASQAFNAQSSVFSVTPGQVISLSGWINAACTYTDTETPRWLLYDVTHNAEVAAVSETSGNTGRPTSNNYTVPAGCTQMRVQAHSQGVTIPSGQVMKFAQPMVVVASAAPNYYMSSTNPQIQLSPLFWTGSNIIANNGGKVKLSQPMLRADGVTSPYISSTLTYGKTKATELISGLVSRLNDGTNIRTVGAVAANMDANGNSLLVEFTGGKVQSDGSLTNVDMASSATQYTLASGQPFTISADIAKGGSAMAAIILGNTTNGYLIRQDNAGNQFVSKYVGGAISNISTNTATTQDTKYHTYRLTVIPGTTNTLEGSIDGAYFSVTDASLNLSSGTWPITLLTGGNTGKVQHLAVTATTQHHGNMSGSVKTVIDSASNILSTAFPGGKLQTDGSITNVHNVSSRLPIYISNGTTAFAEATIKPGSGNAGQQIAFKDVSNNGYYCVWQGDNNFVVYRLVAGAQQAMGSIAAHTFGSQDANPHHLRLAVTYGSTQHTIEASIDGVQVPAFTDAVSNGVPLPSSVNVSLGTTNNSGTVREYRQGTGNLLHTSLSPAIIAAINADQSVNIGKPNLCPNPDFSDGTGSGSTGIDGTFNTGTVPKFMWAYNNGANAGSGAWGETLALALDTTAGQPVGANAWKLTTNAAYQNKGIGINPNDNPKDGWSGWTLKANSSYIFSFYAKSSLSSTVNFGLANDGGVTITALPNYTQVVSDTNWHRYAFLVKTGTTDYTKGLYPFFWATAQPWGNGAIERPSAPTLTASTTGGTLVTGTRYYRIAARNANGSTIPGNEANVAVTGPTGSVALSWTAVTGATSYDVYAGTASGGELLLANTTSTTYTDTGSITPAGAMPNTNATHSSLANMWFAGFKLEEGSILGPWTGAGYQHGQTDFALPHNNKNLDNVPNGSSNFSVKAIDGNGKALIDFNSAHTNQGALSKKNSVDLSTTDVTNKSLDNISDGTRKAVTAIDAAGKALIDFNSAHTNQGALSKKNQADLTTDVTNVLPRANTHSSLTNAIDASSNLLITRFPSQTTLINSGTYAGWEQMTHGSQNPGGGSFNGIMDTQGVHCPNVYDWVWAEWTVWNPGTAPTNTSPPCPGWGPGFVDANGNWIIANHYFSGGNLGHAWGSGYVNDATLASHNANDPNKAHTFRVGWQYYTGNQIRFVCYANGIKTIDTVLNLPWSAPLRPCFAYDAANYVYIKDFQIQASTVAHEQHSPAVTSIVDVNGNGQQTDFVGVYEMPPTSSKAGYWNFTAPDTTNVIAWEKSGVNHNLANGPITFELVGINGGANQEFGVVFLADSHASAIGPDPNNCYLARVAGTNIEIWKRVGGASYARQLLYSTNVTDPSTSGDHKLTITAQKWSTNLSSVRIAIQYDNQPWQSWVDSSSPFTTGYYGLRQGVAGGITYVRSFDVSQGGMTNGVHLFSTGLNSQGSLLNYAGTPTYSISASSAGNITFQVNASTLTFTDSSTLAVGSNTQTQVQGGGSPGATYYASIALTVPKGWWQYWCGINAQPAGYASAPYGDGFIPLVVNATGTFPSSGSTSNTGGGGVGTTKLNSCPADYQLVLTKERGYIRADEIDLGMHLPSFDGGWNEIHDAQKLPSPIWQFTVERDGVSESFDVNDGHAVKDENGNWLRVCDMKPGDKVLGKNGTLTVTDAHYVGEGHYIALDVETHEFAMGETCAHNATTL